MTQPPRTTETNYRDNAAIRDIFHRIRDLTVPDRATVALGLVGHLAATMNRGQITKLMAELQEEAERVQDVPPSRRRAPARTEDDSRTSFDGRAAFDGVGQAGRGEFRSSRPV